MPALRAKRLSWGPTRDVGVHPGVRLARALVVDVPIAQGDTLRMAPTAPPSRETGLHGAAREDHARWPSSPTGSKDVAGRRRGLPTCLGAINDADVAVAAIQDRNSVRARQ